MTFADLDARLCGDEDEAKYGSDGPSSADRRGNCAAFTGLRARRQCSMARSRGGGAVAHRRRPMVSRLFAPRHRDAVSGAVEVDVVITESGNGPYAQFVTAGRHVMGADEPERLVDRIRRMMPVGSAIQGGFLPFFADSGV